LQSKFEYTPPKNGYPEWNNNPEIFQLNRMEAHATLMPYNTVEEALTGKRYASGYCKMLNGNWKFSFAENPEKRIKDFYKTDFDCSGWNEIKVPAHWQLEGYDYPQYTNIRYPWEHTERVVVPFAPVVYNPVGSYVTCFNVPENWDGQPVYICFQGVESAFYVWVNGDLIGYSEDSFTPAEFNITPYLAKGENKLGVEVYRWSDASWLEDQDFWRLSGIFRDVYLYSTPELHIYDFKVLTELDDYCENAYLTVKAKVVNYFKKTMGSLTIEAQLYDKNRNVILTEAQKIFVDGRYSFDIQLQSFIEKPLKWSAEEPNLYTLVLCLKDEKATLIETESCRVGFRKFEIKDGLMQINGKRIVFRGMNRHEFNCNTGRVLTYEDMLNDIKMMKQYNINAVRTSHYPNHPYWYELCDEYGMYVMDETNLETHGTWQVGQVHEEWDTIPGSKPWWTGAVIDRANSMMQRDKNHACVIIWSLGNESFGGENFIKMHDFLREKDPTRPVHYEGMFRHRPTEAATDIESHMYSSIELIQEYVYSNNSNPKKPFLLCEYTHGTGNSTANLFKYWELFEKHPILQGGFIWDWLDKALKAKTPEGIEYFTYGGDFGDMPNDANLGCNGMLFADSTPSPKIYDVKKCYQSVSITAEDFGKGIFNITNKFLFTDLAGHELLWKVEKNGEEAEGGKVALQLPPETSGKVVVPYTWPNGCRAGDEYILTISIVLAEDKPWADKGHEIAFEQFILPVKADVQESLIDKRPQITVKKSEKLITVEGSTFKVDFDKESGDMISYRFFGVELVKIPLAPNFWRACTDNDRGTKHESRCATWREAGGKRLLNSFEVIESEDRIELCADYMIPTQTMSYCRVSYTVTGDGVVKVDYNLMPGRNLPEIPEIGMMLIMDKDFENFKWYGKGPYENYWDRSVGVKTGIYSGKVKDQFVPYIRPQECGNKTDVRWATITNKQGIGLKITGQPVIELNVLPYTPYEVEKYDHVYKLPESDNSVLRINYRQMGVGGDRCWGTTPVAHPEFLLYANRDYSYSFTLQGILNGDGTALLKSK
jgi:beta-galactosidase